jgi:hypothetical protein
VFAALLLGERPHAAEIGAYALFLASTAVFLVMRFGPKRRRTEGARPA